MRLCVRILLFCAVCCFVFSQVYAGGRVVHRRAPDNSIKPEAWSKSNEARIEKDSSGIRQVFCRDDDPVSASSKAVQ
jgi:hypothetical protein